MNTPTASLPADEPQTPWPWSNPGDGLPLEFATPRAWTEVARGDLDQLLVDHAHCEQKAASAALAMIGRFPRLPGLARRMLALAQEEMHHFRQVLDRIEARGQTLGKPLPDPYVRELRRWGFRHPGGLGPLGDLLLVSAFVEARSCERFRLLAESLLGRPDPEDTTHLELGRFYLNLADAEARHWEVFRDLALEAEGEDAVARRVQEMARAEAEIVARRPLEPRMH